MAPPQRTMNAKGFVLLEGLICIQVLILFITGLLVILFVVLTQIWLHGEAHEALLCLKRQSPARICEKVLKEKTEGLLKLPHVHRFTVLKNSDTATEVEVQWRIKKLELKVQRKIDWDQVLRKKALSL